MKFKKIILIFALLSGLFYGSPSLAFTPCETCQPDTYCVVINIGGTYKCNPKKDYNAPCKENFECKSGICIPGQGGEKKCQNPVTGEGYLKFTPIEPKLEIKIPTLQPFTTKGLEQPDAEGNIYFPFIGQYIVGIYKWMLLVAGIIATVMIILGGFTYLTSGGNATQAGQGKERIGAAIFGLILLLGSYMLLYLINPGLVEFRSLKIKVIERQELEPNNELVNPGGNIFSWTTIKGINGITDFKQYDSTWGKTKYGNEFNCTTIAQAGCGPSALADVLNFYGIQANPFITAQYSVEVGARSCNNGTNGQILATKVATKWPNMTGKKIEISQISEFLKQKKPIIFSCHGCTIFFQNQTSKTYAGHFMVLTGINESGTVFSVNDPGASAQGASITYAELQKNNGFYLVEPIGGTTPSTSSSGPSGCCIIPGNATMPNTTENSCITNFGGIGWTEGQCP